MGETPVLELELELAVELALEDRLAVDETAPLAPEEKAEEEEEEEEEELLTAPVAAWLTVVPLE